MLWKLAFLIFASCISMNPFTMAQTFTNGSIPRHHPSWDELKRFLSSEKSYCQKYDVDKFTCVGFALSVRDHARDSALECAFVEIEFHSDIGHALTAFRINNELVYIDSGEGCTHRVTYIEQGKSLGFIDLEDVRNEFIDCSGDPGAFYSELKRVQYFDSLFAYPYYELYTKRRDFLHKTIAKRNTEVDTYHAAKNDYTRELAKLNAQIELYNSGSKSDLAAIKAAKSKIAETKANLDSTVDRLNTWLINIDALQIELGTNSAMNGVVKKTKIYW